MTTIETVTNRQIRNLSNAAAEAGDLDMVAICDKALNVATTIKAQREASRLCSEMAHDTADNAESAAEFASQGEEIDNGYETALAGIADGRWVDAVATLEGVRDLEKAGGDDQHATRSIEAIQARLECVRCISDAESRAAE